MITNLFSTFDPSTSLVSRAWLIIAVVAMVPSSKLWKMASTEETAKKKIIRTFRKEVSYTLPNSEKGTKIILILIFITILPINFLAIYPQIFSTTAHLTMNLPMSLCTWLTIIIFGWIKNTKHMLSHLLPQGTPVALINFIVLIELVSNLIRPITLCVRLTANIIAGHLLISLLGRALIRVSMSSAIVIIVAPLTLRILEGAVACIQAYVFMTLITLYTAEIK